MQANVTVETPVSNSVRARQVSAMFDVPARDKCALHWNIDLPIDASDWSVGLIVGPSGSGKSTVAKHLFGEPAELAWGAPSVIDDFAAAISVEQIAAACQAVGFATIPAWLRPFAVLSNGEKFRVEMARRLLEHTGDGPIVVDEFTSVVDRQVAQIGSHAVQKHVRRAGRRFVAVTCHYDVVEWLQPDWVLDMATCSFQRRRLQQRPAIECVVGPVPFAAWRMFAPFHYLSGDLNRSARCFGLWANGELAAFAGVVARPHPTTWGIFGVSRLVTLPDWQGLGLGPRLACEVGALYRAAGRRLRTYPAHPALVRTFDRSPLWRLEKKPGTFSPRAGATSSAPMGGRPCAVFEYVGPPGDAAMARRIFA